jgi:glycosyltransferase involved in cell wall biosynthesis
MKISVVMTTYNGARYLEEQIESLLNQTLFPDEIIVCDDCSSDGTLKILDKYQIAGKLSYYINDHQLGLINNFKKVVSLAQESNYVALCDQDDIWLPDKLEKCAALFENMDRNVPNMVHSDLILVNENNHLLNKSFRNEFGQDKYMHNLESLLFGNFVTGCTIVMNPHLRTFFSEIPSDVQFHDSWIALVGFSFGKVREVPEALIRYRKHDTNLSIAPGTKPRNRYRSTLLQIFAYLRGDDDFLLDRINSVQLFYNTYGNQLTEDKKKVFKQFLSLKGRSYFLKKFAYRRMVNLCVYRFSCGN